MPGESPAVFGDALRRLSASATYLYQDGRRFWYSTQPPVTKLAEDRTQQFRREQEAITREIEKRLRLDLRKKGDFSRVHPLPQSSQDVPDDPDARLVVLGIDYPYSKGPNSPALIKRQGDFWRPGAMHLDCTAMPWFSWQRIRPVSKTWRRLSAATWPGNQSWRKGKNLIFPPPGQTGGNSKGECGEDFTGALPEAYQWLLVLVQISPPGTCGVAGLPLQWTRRPGCSGQPQAAQ